MAVEEFVSINYLMLDVDVIIEKAHYLMNKAEGLGSWAGVQPLDLTNWRADLKSPNMSYVVMCHFCVSPSTTRCFMLHVIIFTIAKLESPSLVTLAT
eukprot:scaffold124319_cov85-Cyclotella_meneghiniana.AAC.9